VLLSDMCDRRRYDVCNSFALPVTDDPYEPEED
jgi:hypothetical protein